MYITKRLEWEQMRVGLNLVCRELIGWLDGCGLLLVDLMWVTENKTKEADKWNFLSYILDFANVDIKY